MGQSYSWTGSSSITFGVASNWIDLSTGTTSTSVPGAQDTADLFGAGLITGSGTVAVLDVAGTSNGYTLGAATIGAAQVDITGPLALNNGTQLSAGTMQVGSAATGAIVQVAGSTLSGQAGTLDLTVSTGADSQPSALLALDGSSAAPSLVDIGQGTAVIGDGSAESGTLFVFSGTLAGGAASSLVVGQDGAFGTGTITTFGTVALAGTLSIGDAGIGQVVLQGGALVLGSAGATGLSMGVAATGPGQQAQAFLDSTGGTILLHGAADIGVSAAAQVETSGGGTLTTQDGVTLGVMRSGQGTISLGAGTGWADTGDVTVGVAGFGVLSLTGSPSGGGTDTLAGTLALGTSGGAGNITITSQTLRVTGPTLLAGGPETDSLVVAGGGVLDSSGQTVSLAASAGDTLGVTGSFSALRAGVLTIGNGSNASFNSGATGTLGAAAGSPALGISGGLQIYEAVVGVTGGVSVTGANQGAHGLEIDGGTLTVAGSAGLSVSANGQVNLSGSTSVLSVGGGIVLATGGSLNADGTVSATASGGLAALTVASGGSLNVYQGVLHTTGAILEDGSFQATDEQIASTSMTVSGPTAFVHLTGGNWAVSGGVVVGNDAGNGEIFLQQGATASIAGTLAVGSGLGTGYVDTGQVLCGPGLAVAAGQTGLAADAIAVTGAESLIFGTSLQVGFGSGAGSLTIAAGKVDVTGDARLRGNVVLSQGGTLSAGGTISVAAGTTLIGQGTLSAASIADAGRIGLSGGTMTCLGPVSGPGLLSVRDGDLVLGQSEAATVGLVFGNDGTFTAASIGDLAGTITGWQPNDALDFTGVHIATESFSNGTLSLFGPAGHLLGHEVFAGSGMTSASFTLSSDHGTGTLLGYHG